MKYTVCYVVECSAGSYDDYHTWVSGIFLDALDAENLKREIEVENEVIKNTPCPIKEEDLDFLTKDSKDIYYKWYDAQERVADFGSVIVKEMPLNSRIR